MAHSAVAHVEHTLAHYYKQADQQEDASSSHVIPSAAMTSLSKPMPLPPIVEKQSILVPSTADSKASSSSVLRHQHHLTHTSETTTPLAPTASQHVRPDTYSSDTSKQDHTLLVSLRVCKDCQNTLLHAFHHCLSRQGPSSEGDALYQFTMDSIHQIDEIEDGKRLQDPPYLGTVKDPTRAKNTLFFNAADKIARDRATYLESKRAAIVSGRLVDGPNACPGDKNQNPFSGSLYKRTLEAKAKEIQVLREKLYDKIASEKFEHENVERLRHALNKSIKFCAMAEEWHANETARLQYDVRCLKAEMSSLMAFLINSEEEKRKLTVTITDLTQTIQEKESKIVQMDTEYQDIKKKLHDSYKEYLSMTEAMKILEKEATLGPEIVRNRNEILQRNLDKLSRDFETASKEVALSQLKIKELEFELEEMMSQFNACGEAKRLLEEEKVQLLNNLATTTNDLRELHNSHEVALVKIAQLDEKVQAIGSLHSTTKSELEAKISTLTKDLDVAQNGKRDGEATIKLLRSDNEKLSSALKSVNRAKDQMENEKRQAEKKHEKDVQQRDDRLKELQDLRNEDAKAIRKLQEHKEKLMFQVTDLQNSLDREAATVNSLNFELTQLRKSTDENITALKDQLEKVNVARVNLTSDKRQLMEKIKSVRGDLAKKEDEFNNLTAEFNAFKEKASQTESNLRGDLTSLQDTYKTLQMDFASSESKNQMLVESNVILQKQCDTQGKRLAVLEQQDVENKEEIKKLQTDNATLTTQRDQAVVERGDMKIHLDSVVEKVNELNATLMQQERESRAAIAERDTQIAKLNAELYASQEGYRKMEKMKSKLHQAATQLAEELEKTKDALAKETSTREKLEVSLDDLRHSYSSERKIRLDLERMKMKLNRNATDRQNEQFTSMMERNRHLTAISRGLSDEYSRLEHVSHLLPSDADLNTTPAPPQKDFHIIQNHLDDATLGKKKTKVSASKPPTLTLYNVIQQAERICEENEGKAQ